MIHKIHCPFIIIMFIISFSTSTDNELDAEVIRRTVSEYSNGEGSEELLRKYQKLITQTHRGLELFKLGVEVNQLANLSHGMPCNPLKQIVLDDPPDILKTQNQASLTERIDSIVSWQQAIVRTEEPMCDLKRSLRCDPETSTCACKAGRPVLDSTGLHCELLEGQNCGEDYQADGSRYYDPFRNFTDLIFPPSPPCTTNTSCTSKQFFRRQKCWCEPGKSCQNNLGIAEKELRVILDRNSIIADNFVSNLDQNCEPNLHHELLNPPGPEQIRTMDRLERLKTFSDFDTYFCDVRLHLNCSERTKTCDCWRFLTFEQGHCRIKNLLPCHHDFDHLLFYDSLSVNDLSQMLHIKPFRPACIAAAGCQKSKSGNFRCQCHDHTQAGAFCNETKATLTRLLEHIWKFPSDDRHIGVFHAFNQHFLQIETHMTLTYENDCYSKNAHHFESLFHFIFKIFTWPTPKLELKDFEEALAKSKIVAESKILFCNSFLGLSCVPVEHRCRCMEGFHWNAGAKQCELDSGASCEFNPVVKSYWNFQCPPNSVCSTEHENDPKICKCHSGLEGYKCHQKSLEFLEPTTAKALRRSPGSTAKAFSFFKSPESNGIRNSEIYGRSVGQQKPKIVQHPSDPGQEAIEDKSEDNVYLQWPAAKIRKPAVSSGRSIIPMPQLARSASDVKSSQPDPGQQSEQTEETTEEDIVYLKWPPPEWSSPTADAGRRGRGLIPAADKIDPLQIMQNSMNLKFNETCDPSYDRPELMRKIFDPQFFATDGLDEELENAGRQGGMDKPRCNAFLYLECDNVTKTCQCDVTFDLEVCGGGRCCIKTNDLCLRNDSLLGERFGVISGVKREPPPCNAGHVCDRIRFNLFRCRPLLRDELAPPNCSGRRLCRTLFIVLFVVISNSFDCMAG